jgi:hypothetical protein
MRYWITPPELYEQLDQEFKFDFDPCPYPKPDGYDGLTVDWGQSNYINPPFRRGDALNGKGPTAFVRKAIEQQQHGKRSVLLLPTPAYVNLMLDANVTMRPMGRIRWLDCDTNEPWPAPRPITAFILE